MEIINNFIVFEGCDGSGTTTQLDRLSGKSLAGKSIWTTCEPTRGPVGALIREALSGRSAVLPETLCRLFAADRTEHLFGTDGVLALSNKGAIVISDRYTLSSLVYQGLQCGTLPSRVNADFPLPAMLFFFDIEPELALTRIEQRKTREIFEYLDFQIQVRNRYKALLPEWKKAGVHIVQIDANQPIKAVSARIWQELKSFYENKNTTEPSYGSSS